MGEARGEGRKSEGFYQPDVRKRIKFSITKDNISKIQMSLCIVEKDTEEFYIFHQTKKASPRYGKCFLPKYLFYLPASSSQLPSSFTYQPSGVRLFVYIIPAVPSELGFR